MLIQISFDDTERSQLMDALKGAEYKATLQSIQQAIRNYHKHDYDLKGTLDVIANLVEAHDLYE